MKPSMMRRASAISSGVHWEKSLRRSISRALKSMTSSGGGFELLFGGAGVFLALADVEDVLLVLGALGRVPPLRLLLSWRPAAAVRLGVFWGTKGSSGAGLAPSSSRQKRENSQVEDGDLLGRVTTLARAAW